jgi:hypothetical protein
LSSNLPEFWNVCTFPSIICIEWHIDEHNNKGWVTACIVLEGLAWQFIHALSSLSDSSLPSSS